MDTANLWGFLPAISILLAMLILVIIVLLKFGDKLVDKAYDRSTVLLFITSFLFVLMLVVHLFKPQAWTADLLKVIIGILVGAGTSKVSKTENADGSSVDVSGGLIGGDVAGRDINKNIQHLKDAFSKIENAVAQQHTQVRQVLGTSANSDFLVNTIYERGDNMASAMERVIRYWTKQNWSLKHFSSDYGGMDGIYLVFTKAMAGTTPEVYMQQGSDTKSFHRLPA